MKQVIKGIALLIIGAFIGMQFAIITDKGYYWQPMVKHG